MVADKVADMVADKKKVTFMELDVVADKTADMDWRLQGSSFVSLIETLYLLTTPTGQRYIVNSSSGNQLFPPCGFWPLSRPMDFNFNLHAMPILSPFPPLVVN